MHQQGHRWARAAHKMFGALMAHVAHVACAACVDTIGLAAHATVLPSAVHETRHIGIAKEAWYDHMTLCHAGYDATAAREMHAMRRTPRAMCRNTNQGDR